MPDQPGLMPIDHGGPVERPFEPFPQAALNGSVAERFAAVARRFQARLAIADREHRLTYAEVERLVGRIAMMTIAATDERPGPVAIMLTCEARFPIVMLGVLAAGRGYVPLDAGFPLERNKLIAAHAGVAAVISAGPLARHAGVLFPADVPILNLDEAPASAACLRPLAAPATSEDLAYIIYTSGSTGGPKGVYQNQRNLLHDVLQYTNALHLDCEDRLSLLYSPSVAGAIPDIYGALLNGASLHILPPRDLAPAELAHEIRSRGITIYHSVPTLSRRVVEALGDGERFDTVRIAYFSGDRVDWSDVDIFKRGFPPEAFLYLALNSTESARTYCHWFADPALRSAGGRLPVGRDIPDRALAVVDDEGRPVADGEVGEFVLESRYVGLGYWRAPGLTKRHFTVPSEDTNIRKLKTGDLGVRRPDGLYEFRGRKDQRIKLHGHGIEPAEVEMALGECAGVREAAVVLRKDEDGTPRALVAYVELESGMRGLLPRHLAAMLGRSLPRYMIPASIFILDELPRLSNFKIDRVRLTDVDAARATDRSERNADALIDRIARIYEEVLGVAGATAEDSLLTLGGDSLQLLNLVVELERQLELQIPLELLEDSPSIGEVAHWVATEQES